MIAKPFLATDMCAQTMTDKHRVNSTTAKLLRALLIGWAVLGLSACGGDETVDLRTYVQQVKARQKGRIPPLPKPQEFEKFIYNDNVLRDPFIPTAVIEAAEKTPDNGLKPDKSRERDVLEQFALGSMKMMGSLEKNGRRWALIRAADGTLYRTTIGRHMGQNDGEITKISETELELREIVPDGLGGYVERFTTLAVSE